MVCNIDFNKGIYSLNSVILAANRYKELAEIIIDSQNDSYIECKIRGCSVDEELLKKEFKNYVLALNLKRGL
jgi:hypothetical protein